MQLFYNSEISIETKQITFDKIESKHIVRVLRKKEDDILKITNGKGYLFDVKISLKYTSLARKQILKIAQF